ncbi:MAG: hypothetical protein L0229_15470 [Blastocatellia bacterium]|nr:hypothetical protein [Blastocatellia bacterium]
MPDVITRRASLVGQVIEDLTYEPLALGRFGVELVGVGKSPQYKAGGLYVFSDIAPDEYTLRIFGEGLEPESRRIVVPSPPPDSDRPTPPLVIGRPGDDESVVVFRSFANGGEKITLDRTRVIRKIRAGAVVLGQDFSAKLAADLDMGEATQARLTDIDGTLAEGSIVRIVRNRAIRLKFNPYRKLPSESARLIGRVALKDAPEIPLAGARVRLTQVNGVEVMLGDIAGAKIASVDIDGTKFILGAEKDIDAFTNSKGDWNLYFSKAEFLQAVTLEASLSRHQPDTKSEPISAGQRKKVDFQLARS